MNILVLILVLVPGTNSFNLTILHTNDLHARYEETNVYSSPCTENDRKNHKCFGGYARLISQIKALKEQYTNTIVLDGGDQFQGTSWFYHFGGLVTSYFMNLLQYDVMTLGNHEFDNKVEGLLPFLDNVTFPVISSNIDASQEPSIQNKFSKSTILTVDDEQIAIIGYTTNDTPSISRAGNLIFKDELISVREEVEAIKAVNPSINKFIALGHAGFPKDKKIAREVDEIDIVIGGHTNTFLYTGDAPSIEEPVGEYPHIITKTNGKKALVVQDYAYGKYLGFLNVLFTDDGHVDQWKGNPILLDKSVPQDPEILELMKPWREKLQMTSQNIKVESTELLQEDIFICRRKECKIGNVITDSMLKFYTAGQKDIKNVSIAFINSGCIPVDKVPPFRNSLVMIELTGSIIKDVLEHSVSQLKPHLKKYIDGRFLQVSGLKVRYNIYKPVGERVMDIQVLCTICETSQYTNIIYDQLYTVILPNFIADGGDGYTVIDENKYNQVEIGNLDTEFYKNHLVKMPNNIHKTEGRIEFIEEYLNCPSTHIRDIFYCNTPKP